MTPYEIEVEANKIMTRIQEPKRNQFSLKLGVAIGLVLLGLFIPGLLQNNDTFTVSKVSANEYLINLFGDEVTFNLYGFVENKNTVIIDEYTTYHKGGYKYIDITNQLTLTPIQIREYSFIEVSEQKEVKAYLYIANYDAHNRSVVGLGNEFKDFKAEMSEIIALVEKYPYKVKRDKEEPKFLHFERGEGSENLTSSQLQMYDWFLKHQLESSHVNEVVEIEYCMLFDGTVGDIGKRQIPYVQGAGYGYYNESFPVTLNEELLHGWSYPGPSKGANVTITSYTNLHTIKNMIANGIKIEFDEVNPDEYEVEITQKGMEVKALEIIKEENVWYIMPFFIDAQELLLPATADQNQYIQNQLSVKVVHKETRAVLHEHEDTLAIQWYE